jgi:hypothetical protein
MRLKRKWARALTMKEIHHIADTTATCTLAQYKANRVAHKKMEFDNGIEPCFECRHIAIKLGLE